MTYQVNKGVGGQFEFFGLRGNYLWIMAAGIVASFLLVVILGLCGLPTYVGAVVGLTQLTLFAYLIFRLNHRYGPYGLMKLIARHYQPDYLSSRRRVKKLLR